MTPLAGSSPTSISALFLSGGLLEQLWPRVEVMAHPIGTSGLLGSLWREKKTKMERDGKKRTNIFGGP